MKNIEYRRNISTQHIHVRMRKLIELMYKKYLNEYLDLKIHGLGKVDGKDNSMEQEVQRLMSISTAILEKYILEQLIELNKTLSIMHDAILSTMISSIMKKTSVQEEEEHVA